MIFAVFFAAVFRGDCRQRFYAAQKKFKKILQNGWQSARRIVYFALWFGYVNFIFGPLVRYGEPNREKAVCQKIVFLTNGFQMRGIVRGFDNFVVILDSDGKQQMIYKHAISTLIPQNRVDLHASREERAAEW